MAGSAKSSLFETENKQEMKEDAMNFPTKTNESFFGVDTEKKEEVTENSTEDFSASTGNTPDDIQDIDLSVIRKKRFRINGDNSLILELNTSDLNVAVRLEEAYKKLNALMDEVGTELSNLPDNEEDEISDEQYKVIKDTLSKLDKEMRSNVDYIFDANVSEVCAPFGNMWDPVNGAFRYEHIIDVITALYTNELNNEFSKMRSRVNRRVSQYTKKHKH